MSVDLATQIRDYAREVHTDERPLTLDEITQLRLSAEPVRPIGLRQDSGEARPRRRWLVAVAAAAAALVLVGAVALLSRAIESETPVATTDPLSSSTLSRVPHDEAVFGGGGDGAMLSVTAGGPGFVAVGFAGSDAAAWTSPDGTTWSRIPQDERVFGVQLIQRMNSVTAGGPGLVAVGSEGAFGPAGLGTAAVWTSVDGVTWSRVAHDEAVFGGEGPLEMVSVTAGGSGLVAVGSAGSDAAVWTSPDGITWSRVPHDEAVFGGEGSSTMRGVTAGGPGLVAVGSAGSTDRDAAVWTSPDGITWSRVPHDEAAFGGAGTQRMNSVAAAGPGFVAVGFDESDPDPFPWGYATDAAVWTSPDGLLWSRVAHSDAVFDATVAFGLAGGAEMTSVTVGGPGLVAVGEAGSSAAVWTSPDGITWSPIFLAERLFQLGDEWAITVTRMSSVSAGGPAVVAVGSSLNLTPGTGSEEATAAVWVAPEDG
jgi:hypothetical protein